MKLELYLSFYNYNYFFYFVHNKIEDIGVKYMKILLLKLIKLNYLYLEFSV